jgi:DNA-binding IclR family transcriptional regulator
MDATDEAIPPPTDAAADALARILFQLQQAFAARGGGLSLARLSKRCALRMSTLRRYLAALEQGGFITLEIAESGIGSAAR